MIVRYLMMLMPYVGDPWEEHDFDDMPQTGLHAETGLGNDNHTAGRLAMGRKSVISSGIEK
jgi:hypothetical protein